MPQPPDQVLATDLAIHLTRVLREKHGPLLFHQSGGCCDGSSPMCYPRGESSSATPTSSSAKSTASLST